MATSRFHGVLGGNNTGSQRRLQDSQIPTVPKNSQAGLPAKRRLKAMKKHVAILAAAGLGTFLIGCFLFYTGRTKAAPTKESSSNTVVTAEQEPDRYYSNFEVQVMVDGRPLAEYIACGSTDDDASECAEYEVSIRNPVPVRVAVALSVDGLNTSNARHTTALLASKWMIAPYQTIHIRGWQVSSERAR